MIFPNYEMGDILKWKTSESGYSYGMLMKMETMRSAEFRPIYSDTSGIDDDLVPPNLIYAEPMAVITVFSFEEQKVKVLYQNPEDVPLFVEKVSFSKEST